MYKNESKYYEPFLKELLCLCPRVPTSVHEAALLIYLSRLLLAEGLTLCWNS